MKIVCQRIPGQWARNRQAPMTETVQTITRNDQLPLTGGAQMLATSNVGGWCAAVHRVWRPEPFYEDTDISARRA